MLKDKNVEKAKAIIAANPTKKLSQTEHANMIADYKLARDAYQEQDRLVKRHYKDIYEPMCSRKAELEIRMHELKLRLDSLSQGNPAADALLKHVLKALDAKLS